MTEADVYSEELKVQSVRDLELARRLAGLRIHSEHIAWLCEQSYEKILKHVFASYLANQGARVEVIDGKLRRATLAGSQLTAATIDIARDVSRAYFGMILGDKREANNEKQTSGKSSWPLVAEPRKLWTNFEASIEKLFEQTVNALDSSQPFPLTIQNCTKERFLAPSSSWSIFLPLSQKLESLLPLPQSPSFQKGFDPMTPMEILIRNSFESIRSNFSEEGFARASDLLVRLARGYYSFVLRAIMLAYWLLPLSEAARYPMPEYHSENLKRFREFEQQLVDFYDPVCLELQKLIEASAHFNEVMADLRKFVYSEG